MRTIQNDVHELKESQVRLCDESPPLREHTLSARIFILDVRTKLINKWNVTFFHKIRCAKMEETNKGKKKKWTPWSEKIMEGKICAACHVESSVIKCRTCEDYGSETWWCPDCLELVGECSRCAEREMSLVRSLSCGALEGPPIESLTGHERAGLGRDLLNHAFSVSGTMTT